VSGELPSTAAGRWWAEVKALAARSGVELIAAAVVSAVFLHGQSGGVVVVGAVAAWGFWYMVSCAVWPLRTCWRCAGTKQPRFGDGLGSWRDKVCRRCVGSGELRRWGALMLGRGAPDRHDETKEQLTR
jgi:hypothetical protein